MKQTDCPFCTIEPNNIILKNDLAFVIKDKYPHSKGHLLIIPYDHVENYFDLNGEVQSAINNLLIQSKKYCDENFNPSGYNVNINAGKSAGQIVQHTHVHLIPRYK